MRKQRKMEYDAPSMRALQIALEDHICSPMKIQRNYVDGLQNLGDEGGEEGETYYLNY